MEWTKNPRNHYIWVRNWMKDAGIAGMLEFQVMGEIIKIVSGRLWGLQRDR